VWLFNSDGTKVFLSMWSYYEFFWMFIICRFAQLISSGGITGQTRWAFSAL